MLIQFIFLVVFAIALWVVWKRAKEQVISVREALAWSVLWIGGASVVFAPQTATMLARLFGIGRGADLMMYASVVVIFLLLFRMMISMDRFEKKLAKIVTEISLGNLEKREPPLAPHP